MLRKPTKPIKTTAIQIQVQQKSSRVARDLLTCTKRKEKKQQKTKAARGITGSTVGGSSSMMMSAPPPPPVACAALATRGAVLVDGADTYHESLGKVDASKNMDRFYLLQVIEATDGSCQYWTFNSWGRSGTDGQSQVWGPYSAKSKAVKVFEQKFRSKTGINWSDRRVHIGSTGLKGKYTIQSKYFTNEANTGTATGTDTSAALFKAGAFQGEGRHVHVLLFYDFGSYGFLTQALQQSGLTVHLHKVRQDGLPNLDAILADPARNTVWIIAGNSGGWGSTACVGKETSLSAANVKKIAVFHRQGGGLAIWGDNEPFVHEANLVMSELGLGKMTGNFQGGTKVGAAKKTGDPGFNTQHPILFGIGSELHEGVTIAALPEELLTCGAGWVELMRASDRRLLTAYCPPQRQAGPIVLHGAFTQLYCDLTAKGQSAFVTNLGTYTVLRGGDTQ